MKELFVCLLVLAISDFTHAQENMRSSYAEQHRPQFHFSPPAHWMNDPNGMIYHDSTYQLFYQYYPGSSVWGPMHWGHASSRDLVHWNNLPVALSPDSTGYIFSGSAVADFHNSSGFGSNGKTPLVAIFTRRNPRSGQETQCLAYSNDEGKTWTLYAGNPVIRNPGARDFRDPKVSWNQPAGQWVMTLAVGDHVSFYRSPDLKHWAKTGDFGKHQGCHGGTWECPDLFPMNTAEGIEKWVLIVNINPGGPNGGSGTQYFVGNFDGNTFINEFPPSHLSWIDYGKDDYAGVSWNNTPGDRRLFIGWMSNWQYAQAVPTSAWRSAMTISRELSLRKTGDSFLLASAPARELEALRSDSIPVAGLFKECYYPGLLELQLWANLEKSTAGDFGIKLSNSLGENVRIGYNRHDNQFYVDRSSSGKTDFSKEFAGLHLAPRFSSDSLLRMHLFIDRSSVELFADDGLTVMTEIFFPSIDFDKISVYQIGGKIEINAARAYILQSIWH